MDIGLANPPVREAPPITTAAIGPKRYWRTDGDAGGAEEPRQRDAGDGIEDPGDHVHEDLVHVHADTDDVGGHGVGAHRLESATDRREPKADDQDGVSATPIRRPG